MLRTKTMLFTLVVIAMAVPSLWAQKKHEKLPEGQPSVKLIQQDLQSKADTAGVSAVCTAIAGGVGPAGYLAGTNKCSSSNALYGFGNSINTTVSTCSDKGGVEGSWQNTSGGALGLTVGQAAVGSSPFLLWGAAENVGGWEWAWPDIYSPAISPSPDIVVALKRAEAVFGFEVSDLTESTYTVTFATTAGNVTATVLTGGVIPSDNGAQRFIGICNVPAITSATIHCSACTSAATAVAQIRGDKFLGF